MIIKEVRKLQTKVLNRYIKLSQKYPILADSWSHHVISIVLNKDNHSINGDHVLNDPISKEDFRRHGTIEDYDRFYHDGELDWYNDYKDKIVDLVCLYINLGVNASKETLNSCLDLVKSEEYSNCLMALVMLNKLKFKR